MERVEPRPVLGKTFVEIVEVHLRCVMIPKLTRRTPRPVQIVEVHYQNPGPIGGSARCTQPLRGGLGDFGVTRVSCQRVGRAGRAVFLERVVTRQNLLFAVQRRDVQVLSMRRKVGFLDAVLGTRLEIEFTDRRETHAVRRKVMTETVRNPRVGEHVVPGSDLVCVAAGDHRRAGGCADRTLAVSPRETRTLFCKPVDVRRARERVPVAPAVFGIVLVAEDVKNVHVSNRMCRKIETQVRLP